MKALNLVANRGHRNYIESLGNNIGGCDNLQFQ